MVTGTAKVRLFKGRAAAVGAKTPHTLYDPQLASFSMEGYDVTAARGFIDLFGLPMKVRGRCGGSRSSSTSADASPRRKSASCRFITSPI